MTDVSPELLAALQRLGVTIPEAKPIVVRSSVVPTVDRRIYWRITCGCFDTFVEPRDASDAEAALRVACEPLHPWYARDNGFSVDTVPMHIDVSNRDEYILWIKRGVK
jgi:hypothetical protein